MIIIIYGMDISLLHSLQLITNKPDNIDIM